MVEYLTTNYIVYTVGALHTPRSNMDIEQSAAVVTGQDSQSVSDSPPGEVFESPPENVNLEENMPLSPSKIPKKTNFSGKSTIRSRGYVHLRSKGM